MAGFDKAKPGDDLVIPASTYNAFIDATIRSQSSGQKPSDRKDGGWADTCTIEIKNASGSDLDRFHVLALSVPTILPLNNADAFQNRLVMDGITPTTAHAGRWGVLVQPIKNGERGRCVVAGFINCKINLLHTSDTTVEVGTTTVLQSSSNGSAQIIWVAGGVGTASATGEQWATIKIGSTGGKAIFGRISSKPAGKGKYLAKSYSSPTADIDPTTDSSTDDIGTTASIADLLFVNLDEIGTGKQALSVGQSFWGEHRYTNSDAKKVVYGVAIAHCGSV